MTKREKRALGYISSFIGGLSVGGYIAHINVATLLVVISISCILGLVLTRPKRVQYTANQLLRKQHKIPKELRDAVFARETHCVVPGCRAVDRTCDHIIPISRGGTTDYGNLQTLCSFHNSKKSDKLYWDYDL